MEITLTLNGEQRRFTVEVGETLLELLRRDGMVGVKHGCEDGSCGACAVLLDGQVSHACLLLAAQAAHRRVTTIEGLGEHGHLHPLQAAFVEAGAVQCGYCIPGMMLTALALLQERPDASEADVREALGGVLCRCTGYVKPVEAVLTAAARMRRGSAR
jgi:aerobic-type carbon monoxide dehydrogenase small subunit (CoxS/CutS family)